MKKTFSILLTLALVLSFSLVVVPAGVVGGSTSTINVSQPVQVTSNSYYERGQSIVYDGSDYWLFYGRSAGCTDPYAGPGNPDVHDYEIYYKKASTVAGLASATPTLLVDANNHNIYLGEISAATDGGTGYIYVYAAVDKDGAPGGLDCDLYRFRTNDGGANWDSLSYTSSGAACGVLPDGAAHHAAVNYQGQLWIAWHDGSGWASKYYSGSWSSKKDITNTGSGTGKFYIEGSNLYFVRAQNGRQDIFEWNGSSWSNIDTAAESDAYDPTIYKIGSNYVCAYAPWDGTKQYIKAKVNTDLNHLLDLTGGTEVDITAGGYSTTNPWVDMWPTGFTDQNGDTYLFYTSERNPSDTSSEIAGNIWYLKVDWPVDNDHYTYIQNAVDAASSGATIVVADGTYNEKVVITTANLIVQAGSKPLIQPTAAPTWPDQGAVNIKANGVTFDGFEVDASLMPCVPSPGGSSAINVYGASDVTVKNNIAHGATSGNWSGMGIVAWDWDGSKTVDRITIEDNEVYDTGRMGIFCMDLQNTWPITYGLTEGHIIRGNTVHDTWVKGDTWGDAGGAIQINVGKDCIIEDNEIYNTASSIYGPHYNAGIYMFGSGTGNIIKCNTIRDNPAGVTLWIGVSSTSIDWEGDTPTSPQVNYNNIYNNTNYGARFFDTSLPMYAQNNWWGDTDGSGPYDPAGETIGGVTEDTEAPPCSGSRHMMNTDGTGDEVEGRILYCPWLGYSAATTTGAGNASFTCSHGCINDLTAVSPTPPNQPVDLPYGVFSFNISCIDPGETVTVSVTLPGPVPAGSVWWKYQNGSWYSLPIGDDDGDDTITITLTDGGQGDADLTVNGEIIDDGGPGLPNYRYLIIRSTEGGRVTKPGEGYYVYEPGQLVKLVATPDDGYRFVEWTHDVRRIDDVNAAETTITVDRSYVVIANFVTEETPTTETSVQYELSVSSTMGGAVTNPGEGTFPYIEGTVVSLVASPDFGYEFINWTGDGISNADSTTVTVTMNGDHAVKANFEFEQTTDTDSGGESSIPVGACFIATAAYGTPTAEQIDVLREFRDVVLLENSVGSEFVALYYRLSPPVADFIAGNSFLKTVVRELVVDPVVWLVEATGVIWRN